MTKQQLIEYSYRTLAFYATYFFYIDITVDIAHLVSYRIFKVRDRKSINYLSDTFIKKIIHLSTIKLLAKEYIEKRSMDYFSIIGEFETLIFKEEIKELSKGYNKYA